MRFEGIQPLASFRGRRWWKALLGLWGKPRESVCKVSRGIPPQGIGSHQAEHAQRRANQCVTFAARVRRMGLRDIGYVKTVQQRFWAHKKRRCHRNCIK